MRNDFLREAEWFNAELEAFYQLLRQGGTATTKRVAIERLRKAVARAEPLAEDPGPHWERLPPPQQRGYLRLVAQVDLAVHELKRLGGPF